MAYMSAVNATAWSGNYNDNFHEFTVYFQITPRGRDDVTAEGHHIFRAVDRQGAIRTAQVFFENQYRDHEILLRVEERGLDNGEQAAKNLYNVQRANQHLSWENLEEAERQRWRLATRRVRR